MADYIKIPKDFKSLHELKDLVNNYDLISRLSNALNNYQRLYIEDYLLTLDGVLQYIPEAQQRSYAMQIRTEKTDSTTGNIDYVWEPKKNGKGETMKSKEVHLREDILAAVRRQPDRDRQHLPLRQDGQPPVAGDRRRPVQGRLHRGQVHRAPLARLPCGNGLI